jgi:hypothetical protein
VIILGFKIPGLFQELKQNLWIFPINPWISKILRNIPGFENNPRKFYGFEQIIGLSNDPWICTLNCPLRGYL